MGGDVALASAQTEAAVVAELAFSAAEVEQLEPGALVHVIVIHDLERFAGQPARRRGEVVLWDAPAFLTYVNSLAEGGTAVYSDVRGSTMTAVINGHAVDGAGWGDHRARLVLRHTPQWEDWFAFCGRMHGQVAFAEFIEDHLADIYDPSGAEMLELAQTFEATTGVEFKSSQLLDSGQRQLRYEETIDARSSNGTLIVPKQVTLGLQPYEGSNSYRVTARFRFRISNGQLNLGLILDEPRKVLETAFDEILADVAAGLAENIPVLAGTPAPALHPGYPR